MLTRCEVKLVCMCVLRVATIRGAACVNIGFSDDGTPVLSEHIGDGALIVLFISA